MRLHAPQGPWLTSATGGLTLAKALWTTKSLNYSAADHNIESCCSYLTIKLASKRYNFGGQTKFRIYTDQKWSADRSLGNTGVRSPRDAEPFHWLTLTNPRWVSHRSHPNQTPVNLTGHWCLLRVAMMADLIPIWRWLMFANGNNVSQVNDVSRGLG